MQISTYPLISIIVPCYNQAQYLPEALDSVLAQTYTNWECIIVNDGSPDNTEEVAKIYCNKDSRFKYIFKENGGLSSARNFGFQFAGGEYLQFLDCDDILSSNKLQLQIEQLREYNFDPYIISVTKHQYFINNDIRHIDVESSTKEIICHDFDFPMDVIIESWEHLTGFCVHTWLWHRTLMSEAGNWDESLCKNEDGEYFSRILSHTKAVKFCRDAVAYYRFNPKSICNTMNPTKEWDQLRSVRLIISKIKKYRYNQEIKDIIYNMYIAYMYPKDLYSEYAKEFKKDILKLGYHFDLIGRGKIYCHLYKIGGKKLADTFYSIKNKIKQRFQN
ncbi:glycosyltransferase family 2 protein [Paludibacter jiangxiensis]|uniref:Glycosyltransferase n=1 Tax=Paludibacter jiangxiensis TaxID=681398 RepID=A0A170ZNR0_9BACT|nr:glycosyltransferase family 2 protein [Paludibacter jiangxiensis]GAT62863.1 glycosyltransferase [Paludibacter jiangxiensis]